jgi:signal transduction histidine kinase
MSCRSNKHVIFTLIDTKIVLTYECTFAKQPKKNMQPPTPKNELARLASLESFRVLDSEAEAAFDEIVELAAQICATPVAAISLVDTDRQWFKARIGIDATQTPRDMAFCSHAICTPTEILEVEDARSDPRFADNPLVTSDPSIRFYAGAPLIAADGAALGTLCVIDRKARVLTEGQRHSLQVLARQAMAQLELRKRINAQQAAAEEVIALQNIDIDQRNAMLLAGEDLVAFLGLDCVYRFVNRAYLDCWQKDASEIVGKSVADLVGTSTFDEFVKPILDRALRGEIVTHESEMDFPGRGMRHVSVTYSPARDRTATIIGIVVRIHDVDHMKKTEHSLQASVQKLVDFTVSQQQFIYILSHDLREPVNTLINFSEVLQADFARELSPPARQMLGFISSGANRMKALVDDLTEYMRLDQADVDLENCDLNEIVRDVLIDLSDNIQRDQASIKVATLPVIKGRASMIRLLFQNLIANAVKFHRPGKPPNIGIDVKSHETEWEFMVKDDGIGIDEKYLPTLFKAFRRLNSRKDFEGTGIGLAMVKKTAEMHGGRVWATSAKGFGSEFFATIAKSPPREFRASHEAQGLR